MQQELLKGEQRAQQTFDGQGLDQLLLMPHVEALRLGIQVQDLPERHLGLQFLAQAFEPLFDLFLRPTQGIGQVTLGPLRMELMETIQIGSIGVV